MMSVRTKNDNYGFKSGLTWRSYMAILYAILVFTPAQIYLNLATGTQIVGISWFTLLFITEIVRLSGRPLTKQEALIVYCFSTMPIGAALNLVYKEWFRTSSITHMFGNAEKVPWWYSPPLETGVWTQRTFFHPSWIVPILLPLCAFFISGLASYALGILAKEIFIEVENLPFPMQQMTASTILTLTMREEKRIRVFAVCLLIGLIYGFIVYTLRFLQLAFKTFIIPPVPIPWIDYNYVIQFFFPGASLGIATDILFVCIGLILPFKTVLLMFIGSFITNFLGNWLSVVCNLIDTDPETPGVQSWWTPGMSITLCLQRSTLYLWACPLIGVSLSAGLMPLVLNPGVLKRSLNVLIKGGTTVKKRIPETMSTKMILLFFFIAVAYSTFSIMFLAPDFPLWVILPMNMLLPIVLTLTSTRMIGETGMGVGLPNINEAIITLSGYQGTDAWFTLWSGLWMDTVNGAQWCSRFKLAQITQTSVWSMLKAWLISAPLALLLSLLYVELLWKIAPIPSALYPGVGIFWPIRATYQNIWITRPPRIFNPLWILYGFCSMGALAIILKLMKIPISIVPLAVGMSTAIPMTISELIGAIIGYFICRFIGEEWFRAYRQMIAGGLIVGENIAVVIGCIISLIVNSAWTLPF